MGNFSRKLFVMQEASHSNLANAFLKAFKGHEWWRCLTLAKMPPIWCWGCRVLWALSCHAGSSLLLRVPTASTALLLLSLSHSVALQCRGWAAGSGLEGVVFFGNKAVEGATRSAGSASWQWQWLWGFSRVAFVDGTSMNRTGRGCLADRKLVFFLC